MGEVTRGARAVVVCPDIRGVRYDLDAAGRLEEAEGLALAIGVVIADSFIIPVRERRPGTLFGAGQVDNIAIACEQGEAELVVIDGALTPIQQRNLEEKLKRKVIDRTGLILEIFGNGRQQPRGACKSSWRIWIINRAASSVAGHISNGSVVALAFSAAQVKPRSRLTGG